MSDIHTPPTDDGLTGPAATAGSGDDTLRSWRDSIDLRLGAAELWELLWRAEGQPRWFGPGAAITLHRHARSTFVDEAGVWRVARCKGVHPGRSATFVTDPGERWRQHTPTEVTVSVVDVDGEARLTIEEVGIAPDALPDVERYWNERVRRAEAVVADIRRRRREVRQAVVVIHGIGEQQPGRTLQALVASGVLGPDAPTAHPDGDGEAPGVWVKPDRWSDSFELRRVTLQADQHRPRTDAYELYWAHLVRDTTVGQVGAWVGQLLMRWPVPRPLLPPWLLIWAVGIVVIVSALVTPMEPVVGAGIGLLALLVAGARLLWRTLGRPLATQVVGDAARYLRPRPANIAHRQAIREAGVDLLSRLHDAAYYDRIIVVGHSLGSVIAYDVVTHLWIERHRDHQRPTAPRFTAFTALERAIDRPDVVPTGTGDERDAQQLQYTAWQQQRRNTQPWLVTDLVTVGSPLTYAEFLMADDAADLERSKADRVLPTCPPVTETEPGSGHQRITFDRPFTDRIDRRSTLTFTFPHHAAPFAVTRWTNIWFPQRRLGTRGDLVGGPVAPQFGRWIRDIPLEPPWHGFAHTRYWTDGGENAHLRALRDALRLDARRELLELTSEIPAFALLPHDSS